MRTVAYSSSFLIGRIITETEPHFICNEGPHILAIANMCGPIITPLKHS